MSDCSFHTSRMPAKLLPLILFLSISYPAFARDMTPPSLLDITAIPLFWQTGWFWLLAAALVTGISLGMLRYRIRRIEAQRRTLQLLLEERTAELTSTKNALEVQKGQLEQTLTELERTRQELILNADKAGMAEIATGVLHNVGNLVNSVNVSTSMIAQTLEQSWLNRLSKANKLMHESIIGAGKQDMEKLAKLVEYYNLLTSNLEKEQLEIKQNTENLHKKVKTIMTVVESQQAYATSNQLTEQASLVEVVEEAFGFKSPSIQRHHIAIEKEYISKPSVLIQRHRMIHVLINLYENAKDAMKETPIESRKLTIRVDQNDGYAYLKMTDTGCGIEKDKLEEVFRYGFTTKSHGHGFGLHSCCNYLKEMNATISADSPGKGQGATFTIRFALPQGQTNTEPAAAASQGES